MSERYQPVDVLRRGQATLSDFLGLVASIPRDLARLVKDARHGRMRVDLDLKRLDTFGDRVHSAIDRATIGIMTASLVIGSSIVMTVAGGPTVFGGIPAYLLRAGRLPDRIRQQPHGDDCTLALSFPNREPT
jgi:ubiquinone biosynthesis protein